MLEIKMNLKKDQFKTLPFSNSNNNNENRITSNIIKNNFALFLFNNLMN